MATTDETVHQAKPLNESENKVADAAKPADAQAGESGGLVAPAAQVSPEPETAKIITTREIVIAFSISITSDLISGVLGFFPVALPFEITVDVITALLLGWFLGFEFVLLLTFMLELPPVISSIPWWSIAVYAKWKGWKVETPLKGLLSAVLRFRGK